eukprot:m.37054 g.37054  ORF g.37054 m.37054 type:complete len:78 (+) comp6716_c1_seq1:161-394(+)
MNLFFGTAIVNYHVVTVNKKKLSLCGDLLIFRKSFHIAYLNSPIISAMAWSTCFILFLKWASSFELTTIPPVESNII